MVYTNTYPNLNPDSYYNTKKTIDKGLYPDYNYNVGTPIIGTYIKYNNDKGIVIEINYDNSNPTYNILLDNQGGNIISNVARSEIIILEEQKQKKLKKNFCY